MHFFLLRHTLSGPVAIMLASFLILSWWLGTISPLAPPSRLCVVNRAVLTVPQRTSHGLPGLCRSSSRSRFWHTVTADRRCRSNDSLPRPSQKLCTASTLAERCFLLLISPLILRLIAGAVIVMDVESELTYRLNAWLSWLVPLVHERNAAVTESFCTPTIVDHCSGRGYESLARTRPRDS